jgi:hypothetical protein
MMHGMAGSAALIVLAAGTVRSTAAGVAYIALFGLGSILGMGLLSVAIAIPLFRGAGVPFWAHRGTQACIGLATIGLGAYTVLRTAAPHV